MSDLELAKRSLLCDSSLSVVLVKDGKILAKRTEKGIIPILSIIEDMKTKLDGASIADKVLGKAAAVLSYNAGIKHFFAKVISERALKYLEQKGAYVEKGKVVQYILNREQTDLCPIEKLTGDSEDPVELTRKIRAFLRI
ncbi:hypothetical protein H0A61_02676 [Koleobacter methoxysyntrophicus]|jgi:hypothetical protein|uniref:DUF1893 domain-containing protein n=1 Tax=Koleobacter methoxysyntrophicus TaxID=2751313 RepID=A0A8A0RPF3_9FIRM|nr:DUF1893 domain-containing protein [Koleobacter methoxysyntrophicus]MDK2901292.1 hypothetical protein [Thermosediminibacterales bacterium]QSQ10275.1 hypothetical protein H0A61_02676 [Koleobacter methoxysyntrophicus]